MPTPQTFDGADLAHQLVELAIEAGRTVMEVYGGEFEVSTKDDSSPVTIADQRAEDLILAGLKSISPGVPVVAEEAYSRGEVSEPGNRFFLVDPLDGTREFISRNGEFTVNIALIDGGAPALGVIVAPAQSRVFFGWTGGGAFQMEPSGKFLPIRARPMPVSGATAVASRSHRDPQTTAYLATLALGSTNSAGSSLKFCLIAAGEADIYPRFGPTCEWDTAAGHAILVAAGGSMTRLDGAPFRYGKHAERYLNPGFVAWGAGGPPPLPDRSIRAMGFDRT